MHLVLDTQCLPAPDTTFGLVHVVPPVRATPFASAGAAGLAYESAMAVEEREVGFPGVDSALPALQGHAAQSSPDSLQQL